MDDYESLMRLAFGNALVLTISREDFALLRDMFDSIENGQPLDDYEIVEVGRVIAELNEQAEAHFP